MDAGIWIAEYVFEGDTVARFVGSHNEVPTKVMEYIRNDYDGMKPVGKVRLYREGEDTSTPMRGFRRSTRHCVGLIGGGRVTLVPKE